MTWLYSTNPNVAPELTRAAHDWSMLGAEFVRQYRYWFALGIPAFAAVIALYALMILKPGFAAPLS